MFLFGFASVLLFLNFVYALTEVKQCKPLSGKTIPHTDVQFADCLMPPCIMKRGENVSVSMIFTAVDNFNQVTNNLYGIMMGIKHGYPGLNGSDGCKTLYLMPGETETNCPIEKGKTYMYIFQIPVKSSFPKITVPVHFGLKDKTSKHEAACFEVTIRIT